MRSKKEWLSWFDSLEDEKISELIQKEKTLKTTPDYLNDKIYQMYQKGITSEEKSSKLKDMFSIQSPFIKYGLSFALLIIIIPLFIFIFRSYLFRNINTCVASNVKGNVYLIKKDKKIKIKDDDNINEKTVLLTEKSSGIDLKIGQLSFVSINEGAEVLINKLYKDRQKEITKFYIKIGEVLFKPKLKNTDSGFYVETDTIIADVVGTEFSVSVDNNKITRVFVKEGSVGIKGKLLLKNIKKIERIAKVITDKINKIINEKIILNPGESIEISYASLIDAENKINGILKTIQLDLEKVKDDKDKLDESIKQTEQKIIEIKKIKESLIKKYSGGDSQTLDSKETKSRFIIEKLPFKPNLSLSEKNTGITTDGNYIFIASDSNGAVFCVNPMNGKLLWTFKNQDTTDITSPVFSSGNNLILSTPRSIFVLDKKGEVVLKNGVESGTTYWASPVKTNNIIYIPTADGIYIFNNNAINKLDKFGEVFGQIYLAGDTDNLYCIDANELVLKVFDLNKNKIIWTSGKFANRVFNYPFKIGKYIFVCDMKSSIYRYDYQSGKTSPNILKIGTGVLTNPVYKNNSIFFIGNDGWFYKIDAGNFKSAKKITQADIKPDYNNYLTKKILIYNNELFFSSNTGKVFYYDVENNKAEMLDVKDNNKNYQLIGSPVLIKDTIYVVDKQSNIYKISRK